MTIDVQSEVIDEGRTNVAVIEVGMMDVRGKFVERDIGVTEEIRMETIEGNAKTGRGIGKVVSCSHCE